MHRSRRCLMAILLTSATSLYANWCGPMHGHTESTPPKAPVVASEILKGYGSGGFGIKTTSAEAQDYFNNGLQLAHAFAHQAAAAAFRRAQQLDPSCAMCFWGEAWSRGPSINFTIGDDVQAQLMQLVEKAESLAASNPPLERKLIAALKLRYRHGGGTGEGDAAYARAMDEIADTYPTDNEVVIMTADAWMIPASQKNTREHLDRAIQLLEAGLERDPNNTGLIHFYMHATESDGVGAESLPYAEKLPVLAPAASHLIHMPSHVYMLLGRYKDAEKANLNAVAIDEANAERSKPKGGVYRIGYHDHNVVFGLAAALLINDRESGLRLAGSQLGQLTVVRPEQPFQQFGLGTAYVAFGRFGTSAEVSSLPEPGAALPYAEAMWHYARAELAARTNNADEVRKEAASISLPAEALSKFGDLSPQASAMMEIAQLVALGRLAMLEKNWSNAEADYRKAAELQEAKLGNMTDPPAWWYPLRRSVAAAMLARGNARAAKVELQQALTFWHDDPLSLRVLAECDREMGHAKESQAAMSAAQSEWIGSLDSVPLSLI